VDKTHVVRLDQASSLLEIPKKHDRSSGRPTRGSTLASLRDVWVTTGSFHARTGYSDALYSLAIFEPTLSGDVGECLRASRR
jgi:hypothetical protein